MFANTLLTTALVALTSFAVVNGNTYVYATFYDDHACTQNGGIAVDVTNPGCLANEYNRNSIYFQSSVIKPQPGSLVISPGNECDCQVDCADDIITGDAHCYDLAGHAPAASYRFIGGGCAQNNC